MALSKKKDEGVFSKRSHDGKVAYYSKIGKEKSKDFISKTECAKDFIEKFCVVYPKYEALCEGKTWEQCFSLFGIVISND